MDLAVWRDISLLWFMLLTLIAALPIGLLLFFAVKGLFRLRQLAKKYLPVAQKRARLAADETEKFSQKVVSPFIAAHALAAQVNGLTKAILTKRRRT